MAQGNSTYSIFGQFFGVQGIVSGFNTVSQASQRSARTSASAWNSHGSTMNKFAHSFQRFYGGEGMFMARNIIHRNIEQMRDYAKEAEKLAHAQFKFRVMGLSEGDNQRAFRAVASTVRELRGLRIDEVTDTITDLHTAFGDLDHAMEHLNLAAKFKFGVSTLLGDKFSPTQIEQQIQNGFKFLEVTGVTLKGADEVEKRFNAMTQMMAATGGRVMASDLLLMARRAGPAMSGMGIAGMRTMSAPIQEMGAARTGSAMMSLYQALIGGRIDQRSATEFMRLGLLGKTPKEQKANIEFTKAGIPKRVKPGAFGSLGDALMNDPLTAADQLMAAMKSPLKGQAIDITNMMAVRKELAVLFGNRMAQQLMNLLTTQRGQIVKEAKLAAGAKSIQEMYDMALDTPMGKIKSFEAELDNLKISLGGPLLGAIAGVAKEMSPFIRMLSAHPQLALFALGLFKIASASLQLGMAWRLSGMGSFIGGGVAAGPVVAGGSPQAQWNALFAGGTPAAANAGKNAGRAWGRGLTIGAGLALAIGIPILLAQLQKLKDEADEAWEKTSGAARSGEKAITGLLARQSAEEARATEKRNVEGGMSTLLNQVIPYKHPEDEGWGTYLRRHLGYWGGGKSTISDYSTDQMAKLMQQQMPGLARGGQYAQARQYVGINVQDAKQREALWAGMATAFPQAHLEFMEAMKKAGGDYFVAVQELVKADQDVAKRLTDTSNKTIEQFYAMGDAAERAAKRLSGLAPAVPEGAESGAPEIPQHARGGIARRASYGIFGERGPEALIPLGELPRMISRISPAMPVALAVHNHFGSGAAVDPERIRKVTAQALREGAREVRAVLDDRARDREQMI